MQTLKDYLQDKYGRSIQYHEQKSTWDRVRFRLGDDQVFTLIHERGAAHLPLGQYEAQSEQRLQRLEPGLSVVQVPRVLLGLPALAKDDVYGLAARGHLPYVVNAEERTTLEAKLRTWEWLQKEVRILVGLEST